MQTPVLAVSSSVLTERLKGRGAPPDIGSKMRIVSITDPCPSFVLYSMGSYPTSIGSTEQQHMVMSTLVVVMQ